MSLSSKLEADAPYEATRRRAIHRQFTTPRLLPVGTQLDNQTVLVTGSNGGIGLAACRNILKLRPSHLILAVRILTRGEEAVQQLRQQFADPSMLISVWILDMESYDSIHQFAEQCATLPRIDIVILNAAIMKPKFDQHPTTGHEMTIQVNYISTALLAILLLPILKASKVKNKTPRPPVLHLVASSLHIMRPVFPKGRGSSYHNTKTQKPTTLSPGTPLPSCYSSYSVLVWLKWSTLRTSLLICLLQS